MACSEHFGHSRLQSSHCGRPVEVQRPAAHTDVAQIDRFAVSAPPTRSFTLSGAPGSFVLCEMEYNDQLRRKFLQRFKMEFGGRPPVCLLNFLTFLPTAKTNSRPLWKRPERFDC